MSALSKILFSKTALINVSEATLEEIEARLACFYRKEEDKAVILEVGMIRDFDQLKYSASMTLRISRMPNLSTPTCRIVRLLPVMETEPGTNVAVPQ